ncbi:UvrD-helicase domain-containing protein [candidate division KSB1 bacterium]|nr:UvrD-helicase domain-containing protein [candidate division KSB1 bacterium]
MPKNKFFPTLFQHLATDTTRNLVVSAGAGAGKTAVLTRRIIKIIREEKLSLNRLMVVTFTDKAAVEMKERVYAAIDSQIGKGGDEHFKKLRDDFLKNRISTFHAFCAALLREYPIEAQIDPYFRVMDETDKIFFLRRIIDRCINELAEQKDQPDLSILNQEWQKGAIINSIYSMIQKREDTGPWLRDFQNIEWEEYYERLEQYRINMLREICIKLAAKNTLSDIWEKLKLAQPDPPDDDSKLSQRRQELLRLLPELQSLLLMTAREEEDFDLEAIIDCTGQVLDECSLVGWKARAWTAVPDNLDLLRWCFKTLRNTLQNSQIDQFEISQVVEEEGFKIKKALARVAIYCLDAYREEKEKVHYLDFQDLQLKVLTLFRSPKHAHILTELRENYLYIMVDEFQDTNSLQWEIVKLIASDESGKLFGDRLFIVGDEKQAIYSFRGGDVTLFGKVTRELISSNQERGTHQASFSLAPSEEVEKDYHQEYSEKLPEDGNIKSGEIIFSDNFRSAAKPIAFFNLFFQELMGKPFYEDYEARPQQLICSGNKREGSVELLLVDRDTNSPDDALQMNSEMEDIDVYTKEAHLIAAKIKEVLTGEDVLYEHIREQAAAKQPAIAILLNRRTKLKVYEEALRRENIDFIVVRGRGFYQRQEIVDLGNLVGFLVDTTNSIYLAGFLRSPVAHVSDEGLYQLSKIITGESLWEKLCFMGETKNSKYKASFSKEDFTALINANQLLLRWHQLSRRMILVDFLRMVLDEGGYFASLSRGNRGEQAISNIEKLLDRAREATLSDQEDLLTLSDWLNERINYVDEEGEADVDIVLGGAVQLMTVHQSKGLEFPMVFVPDLTAFFNFGDRESLRFDDVTASLNIEEDGSLIREKYFEVGVDAVDPENDFEPTPTLIKLIIEKRNREKTIAERKRLFYVAATRAMDHLVLVGQLKKRSTRSTQELEATEIDQLTCWMDWLNKILNLNEKIEGQTGRIKLGEKQGEHISIPYRLFDENQAVLSFEETLRTEFLV